MSYARRRELRLLTIGYLAGAAAMFLAERIGDLRGLLEQ